MAKQKKKPPNEREYLQSVNRQLKLDPRNQRGWPCGKSMPGTILHLTANSVIRETSIALLQSIPASQIYLVKCCARCQGAVAEVNELHQMVRFPVFSALRAARENHSVRLLGVSHATGCFGTRLQFLLIGLSLSAKATSCSLGFPCLTFPPPLTTSPFIAFCVIRLGCLVSKSAR